MNLTENIKIIGSIKEQYEAGNKIINAGDIDFKIDSDYIFETEEEIIGFLDNSMQDLSIENIENKFDIKLNLSTEVLDGILNYNGIETCVVNDYRDWEII